MKWLKIITGHLGLIKLPIWESSFCKMELKQIQTILKFKTRNYKDTVIHKVILQVGNEYDK